MATNAELSADATRAFESVSHGRYIRVWGELMAAEDALDMAGNCAFENEPSTEVWCDEWNALVANRGDWWARDIELGADCSD